MSAARSFFDAVDANRATARRKAAEAKADREMAGDDREVADVEETDE